MATSIGPNVSSTPPPMNIDTPEGSVADGETQYSYLWNVRDLQTIREYKQYYSDMWDFLIVLKEMGPAWQSQESQKLTINLFCVDI